MGDNVNNITLSAQIMKLLMQCINIIIFRRQRFKNFLWKTHTEILTFRLDLWTLANLLRQNYFWHCLLSNVRVEKHWVFNRVFIRSCGDSAVRTQHERPAFLWRRTTLVMAGWFAGSRPKNNKWCIEPSRLLFNCMVYIKFKSAAVGRVIEPTRIYWG